ncbi:hypothetical protein AR679_gp093 [Yellowstone lake phycodnavirus 1]|uniref:hypothetical protein n=1 Tax=Yellowstone lake phycodnavirus 1 TaxID=1586713 RepID=UPI0006EB3E9E|nr:hypothetical protein AR679_gp093 [Yellowstone lake phycodnavirus 1]BAT22119.1 hypothetical protein [Yellowstone lake phycodnavirus 1]
MVVLLLLILLLLCILIRNVCDFDYHVIHVPGNDERSKNIQEMEKVLGQKINIFSGEVGTKHPHLKLKGVHGCYKSHLNLLSKLREHKFAVIFEDDFLIRRDLHHKIKSIIRKLRNKNFDMVYLGNLDNNHGEHFRGDLYKVDKKKLLTGTHAYIVNTSSCQKIISLLKSRMKKAIDLELHDLMCEDLVTAYVVWPYLVNQQPDKLKSTISS